MYSDYFNLSNACIFVQRSQKYFSNFLIFKYFSNPPFFKPRGCLHILCLSVFYACWLGYLDVWGELVNHKRTFPPPPSSQGWDPHCTHVQVFGVFLCLSGMYIARWASFLLFYIFYLASMLSTCIFMYMQTCTHHSTSSVLGGKCTLYFSVSQQTLRLG